MELKSGEKLDSMIPWDMSGAKFGAKFDSMIPWDKFGAKSGAIVMQLYNPKGEA